MQKESLPPGFLKICLDKQFQTSSLTECNNYEYICKGRTAKVYADKNCQNLTPLVRTTTAYKIATAPFSTFHRQLKQQIADKVEARCAKKLIFNASNNQGTSNKTAEEIKQSILAFNNIMCEQYTNEYRKMAFHSDQAQDLSPASLIAVCSFYTNIDDNNIEESKYIRTLVIKDKRCPEKRWLVPMEHGSVIMFSAHHTNRLYWHKIVWHNYQHHKQYESVLWHGITLRQACTFVDHQNDCRLYRIDSDLQYLHSNLTLASEQVASQIRIARAAENKSCDDAKNYYDDDCDICHSTLSAGDLL